MDVGDVLADRYELVDEIGRGGMGRVLRARDRTLDREVAVKLLAPHLLGDEGAVEALREEAQRAAAVRHPNVVQVLDAVLHDTDQPAIVMEYVSGPSLTEVIPNDGMDLDEALEVLRAVGSGLAAVHATGLVHRDVTPANVLLDNGVPRLTDFGIARSASADATTTIRGSVSYLAPEQADEAPIGPAADVYALGCLATRVLTGRPPFSADHPVAVVHKHLHEPAPDVRERAPGVPDDVAAGIAAALQKDPADRPSSVLALLEVLGLPPTSAVPGVTPGAASAVRRDAAVATEAIGRDRLAPDRNATRVIDSTAAGSGTAGDEPTNEDENDQGDQNRPLAALLLASLAILLLAWLVVSGLSGSDGPDTSPSPSPSATASPSPSPSPTSTTSPSPTPAPDIQDDPADVPAEQDPAEDTPVEDPGPDGRGPEGDGPPGQQDGSPGRGRGGGP